MGLSLAAGVAVAVSAISPADSATLRWAFQGQLNALDPYTLNETFTLGQLGNVYEGLTRRGPDLEIEPALAESWEIIEPTRWRFHLRQGVKFHNGNDFNADDVVFSAERVQSQNSDLKTRLPGDVKVEKVDDHTVDFVLSQPNPILHYEWDTWYIMDKEWSEENGATEVVSASDRSDNRAAFETNGTGPYTIDSHEPGVRTVFKANPDWWDEIEGNIEEVVFTPISQDSTRVAALLSGEVDLVDPVPVQDVARVEQNPNTDALTGPELRTIFLGFNSMDDELSSSDIKGENPFKDARVRKALYQAIDIEAIKQKVMRGMSEPSALLISPLLYDRAGEFERHAYDPEAAMQLLEEAGYGDGFTVTMDCPNDRYVNDEAICQAVASMVAKIGVRIDLNAQPKAQYFGKVLATGGYDTDFYLLGWTPSSMDSYNIFANLSGCRDETGKGSPFNLGGWCNEKVDELAGQVLTENDPDKRNELIFEAFSIMHDEVSHIPLHQQSLAWGKSTKLDLVQRADNQVLFKWMTLSE
ncbi:putative gluthatione transporter,solute-binding component [Lutibaculum baratangense AMV1]|uniref:Putative gluthatione transporter,solute-binding component n=2 Tax=Lutibaculum TaxID=1358438 RepID=V4QYI7_9HYPH|nr:ABC transporter substrate-binding protein [Lutibaculum baratangense]ESR24817.1 putative gluthatione transporter,solute-binding component [Lutibaculum baratangense AMV1]